MINGYHKNKLTPVIKYVTKSKFNAATGCHSLCDLRPLALRPCFSTGLPLCIVYLPG